MEEGKSAGTQLAEKLSDPATVNALTHLVDRLTELQAAGVMDSFFQAVQAINFMKDGMTDTMVNKNAAMAESLMAIAAEAASPEILATLRELKEIHRSGKLKDAFEMLQAVGFMKDGMTDTMINKNAAMAETLMEIASEAASPEIMAALKEVKEIHRSGKLKDLFELTDSVSFMLNSTTTKMLERNAEIMEKLYSIANEAADPSMIEAIREIKGLQKSGNLKTLTEASYMVSFLTNAVTDSMVNRLASFMSMFAEEVATPHLTDIITGTLSCMSKTMDEAKADPPKPGFKALMSTMRDPEVQMSLQFMMRLARNLRYCLMAAYEK